MTDAIEIPEGETPDPDPAPDQIQGVYLIRVTLRGNGDTAPPTIAEAEGLVEAKFGELGWGVNAQAERVDK